MAQKRKTKEDTADAASKKHKSFSKSDSSKAKSQSVEEAPLTHSKKVLTLHSVEVDAPQKSNEKKANNKKTAHLPRSKAANKIADEEVEGVSSDEWSDEDVEMGTGGVAITSDEDNEVDADGDIEMRNGADLNNSNASSKSRESHAAQKKLAAERKAARPNADMVTRGKRIWEQIRRRDINKAERNKLIGELCSMIKGHVKDLVFKHDASRIVQTAVKNGTKQQRDDITIELKGSYVKLAQSAYGRYLLVKLMFYGDAPTRASIIGEFYGHVRSLIKHREAAIVVEDAWQFATAAQKEHLIREFYGVEFAIFKDPSDKNPSGSLRAILDKNPEKRPVIMKSLFELLTTLVNKDAIIYSIVHRALLEYITNAAPGTTEITEFLELVKDKLAELAFTKPGAQVVCRCIAHASAKDRKQILKTLKPVISRLAENESGYLVLLTIYEFVDDTVLVAKTLLSEFQVHLLELARHNTARMPLLYPFAGRSTQLLHAPAVKALQAFDELRATNSKKPLELKQSELAGQFAKAYISAIVDHPRELIEDAFGAKFVVAVLMHPSSATPELRQPALEAVAETARGDPQDTAHVLHAGGALKAFKILVQGGSYDPATKSVKQLDPPLNFHNTLYPRISDDIGTWATGKGSYIVLALMEAEGFDHKDEIRSVLKTNLKKLKEADADGNKGAKLLADVVGN